MINMMPDDAKKELRAARVNVILVRYMGIIFLAAAFLAMTLAGSYYLLNLNRESAAKVIASNDVKAEVYDSTKQQVAELSASLTDTKLLLDQEIRFSNVLVNFAKLMPEGTVIEEITLGTATFGSPITVQVYAKSTDAVAALQSSFQSSSLFSGVSFQSTDASGGIEGYPVSATMTITLNRTTDQ